MNPWIHVENLVIDGIFQFYAFNTSIYEFIQHRLLSLYADSFIYVFVSLDFINIHYCVYMLTNSLTFFIQSSQQTLLRLYADPILDFFTFYYTK